MSPSHPPPVPDNHPTVVIGLDGAHFELLEPWISDGILPNIKKLLDEGVSGDLESVIPPVTSPNWKAYATGKNPGKLGIFWWENIDVNNQSIYYPDDRKQAHTEYWEILAENESVGVIGVPTTYPPKDTGEFLIAGAPDGQNSGYTSPRGLEEELEQQYGYQVIPTHNISEQRDRAAEELLDLIDLRFQVALDLFEERELSFMQVTTFYINTLQHYFWDGEYTRKAWEQIDSRIGEFLDKDVNIVLMSDHGATQIEQTFHINPWLESEGYLSTNPGISKVLYRLGLTTERLGSIVTRLGIHNAVTNFLPDSILRRVPNSSGEVSKSGKAAAVDWENTSAIASGQGPVYLTLDSEDDEYEPLRRALINELQRMQTPSGEEIADDVYRTEKMYSGPYLDIAPDILIDQQDGVHIPGDVGRSEIFSKPTGEDWLGENKRLGLFAATGPDFSSGSITDLSILDLAPTILHLFGNPIPTDMDGEVRQDVFAEGSLSRQREVDYSTADEVTTTGDVRERDDEVSERLEDLGYL